MNIIKLDATDSTNSYLKELSVNEEIADYTVVVTKAQVNGRGQMGTVWNSEASKNLTFSVYKDLSEYHLKNPFYISMVVSLALIKALKSLSITELTVKWPNDILSYNKKICGILIENVFKKNIFSSSIIGIGLNVNQKTFLNLPKASSMRLVSGRDYDLDVVRVAIVNDLKYYFNILKTGRLDEIKTAFETSLYKKDKASTFQDAEGVLFSGIIKGVSQFGNLRVLLESGRIKEFDLKTISLVY